MSFSPRHWGGGLMAAALICGIAAPAHAAGLTAEVDVTSAVSADGPTVRDFAYGWSWSDGSSGTRRTFSERRYGTAASLPRLIVEASCADGARIGDRIKLQWRDAYGRYRLEDSAYVSNCNGTYKFRFYPYTSSGAWARGTYKYRLIVPGGVGYEYFEITYTRR